MGAFGRMLIQYWGGDLKAYDNADSLPERKPLFESEKRKLFEEEDEWRLEAITKSVEQLFEKGENALKQIHSDREMTEIFKTDEAFDKFVKWREKFMTKVQK